MNRIFILIFFLIFSPLASIAHIVEADQLRPATDANIFGHVLDAETGEHIPFINILVEGTNIGAITDATGHYKLTNLPPGEWVLVVRGMGYETFRKNVVAEARRTIIVDITVAPSSIALQEVVLTATPTARGFRYQPDKVFLGERLQRRSETSFGEMLNGEPGLAMRSLGSAPSRPVIRGMDGDRILVLQNGERMGDISATSADHSITLDPLAASRIEVVRGPASLLYGSSALGGVVNLITTDIPDENQQGTSGVFSLQGASVNSMAAGFGRFTYGDDNWATSARISLRNSGDISTPNGDLLGTGLSQFDGALGFGFQSQNGSGGFSLSHASQDFGLPVGNDHPGKEKNIVLQRQSLQGRWNFRQTGFFDRGIIRFNAAYMHQDEVETEIEEGVSETKIPLYFGKLSMSSTAILQHRPSGIFDRGAVGLNILAHQKEVGGVEAFTPGERRFTVGAFTFQEIPLSHVFRIQAGIRFDMQYVSAIANNVFSTIDKSRTALNYSGSFGLNYRPIEGLEIGAQFARSHRNPTITELFADGPHLGAGTFEIGNSQLNDEIGNGGDLFMRFQRGSIELELAAFVNHFRNFIVFSPTGMTDVASGFPIFQYTEGEARLMGGEASVSWTPLEGLNLGMNFDYVDGRRLDDGGDNLPFIPPFRARFNAEYDFGWGWIGGTLQSVATQNKVAPEELSTSGYSLIGLQAGYRLNAAGRHVIILRGENLLNERFIDHLSRIENRNLLMPGRNITLAYRWFF